MISQKKFFQPTLLTKRPIEDQYVAFAPAKRDRVTTAIRNTPQFGKCNGNTD